MNNAGLSGVRPAQKLNERAKLNIFLKGKIINCDEYPQIPPFRP